MLDHEIRYAECLLEAARRDEARVVLERRLRFVNRYDAAANLILARQFDADAAARLVRVVHAVRNDALIDEMKSVLEAAFAAPGVAEAWSAQVPPAAAACADAARQDAASLAPERMRVETYRLWHAGKMADALAAQRAAAEAYRALDRTGSPHRRAGDAEWDAWLTLARMIYTADPGQYRQACEAVEQAERFAILGGTHERLRPRGPDPELLGDQTWPGRPPPHQRPLWRWSVKLRLAAGKDRHLQLRALLSLPDERRNFPEADLEISRIAGDLVEEMTRLPPERRPRHIDQLRRLAERS
jgi:hypothetical protein